MPGHAYTGPVCRILNDDWVDSPTLCIHQTPAPGIVAHAHAHSHHKNHHQKHSRKHGPPPARPVPNSPQGFLDEIKHFEGIVDHMYLDTKKLVTVGIGFLIENPTTKQITDDGLNMPFIVDATKKRATPDQIQAEFNAVFNGSKKTSLSLDPAYIQKAFDSKVATFTNDLKSEFGDAYDAFPLPIRYALLDMIFNLGLGSAGGGKHHAKRTGLRAYIGLKKALDNKNWLEAAEHSHRNGPAQVRNDAIKSWFQFPATHPDPSTIPLPPPR